MIRGDAKTGFHPRNRFRGGYDFRRLALGSPSLRRFVGPNEHGDVSIDFANPAALRALNAALLADAYGNRGWDLPPGALSRRARTQRSDPSCRRPARRVCT